MFKKFFCRETEFQKFMFRYADALDRAALEFSTFINSFDKAAVNDWVKRMKHIEHFADEITHETMNWLENTFIVNYDREDIHALISDVDDIIDFMDAASRRISLYNVTEMPQNIIEFTKNLTLACKETANVARSLSGEKLNRKMLDVCRNIKNYEEEGDRIYHDFLADLFKGRKDPLDVIKFKEIIEEMERALDKCNKTAMNIESMIFKYS